MTLQSLHMCVKHSHLAGTLHIHQLTAISNIADTLQGLKCQQDMARHQKMFASVEADCPNGACLANFAHCTACTISLVTLSSRNMFGWHVILCVTTSACRSKLPKAASSGIINGFSELPGWLSDNKLVRAYR